MPFSLAFFATQHFLSSSEEDKALIEKVVEINQSCPKKVDEGKKLESVVLSPNKNFQYSYTLVNVSLTAFSYSIYTMKENVKSSIIADLKTSTGL